MSNEKNEKNEKKLKRRDFLTKTVKGIAAISLPLLAGGKSCKENDQTCDPVASTSSRQTSAKKESQINTGESFDVVVIGSGFGATVAVTQLMEKKKDLKLLVMERGLWWLSPDKTKPDYLQNKHTQYFTKPDHGEGTRYLLSILDHSGLNFPARANPLYKIHSFTDIDVLTASGVGGGSLIYLNVTIPPITEDGRYPIFNNWELKPEPNDYRLATEWMERWRGKLNHIVTDFPVKELDSANLGDKDFLYFGKTRAFKQSSNVSSANWRQITDWKPAPLSIHDYGEGNSNLEDNEQAVCTRQGRCFLGCPPGAIQTLDKTLIKYFLSKPAEYRNLKLEELREVTHLEALPDGTFKVWFLDRSSSQGTKHFYHANKVILAAGTLGSNEILLRSKAESTLQLSNQLGNRFSGNGDLGGFVKGVKTGFRTYPTKGPLITSLAQYQAESSGGVPIQMTVEDGGIPPTMAGMTRILLDLVSNLEPGADFGDWTKAVLEFASSGKLPRVLSRFAGLPNPCDKESFPTEHQLLENYFYFQCMGKDEPTGRFSLNGKKLDLKYSSPPHNQPVFKHLEEIMREISRKMGGQFIRFPNMLLPRPKLFTLHPLGGCAIGRDAGEGVVNRDGRVFKTTTGTEVYQNLIVMDASVFPGPVAVNPTLTIVAVSLKISNSINV